jgi:pimeloyl-ACP methyl ester carboxylesterase
VTAIAGPDGGVVDVAGPPDATPIVLVHGTRLCRTMWAPQMDRLSDEFRTIAPDLPGHGSRAGETFTLDRAADRLAAAIDEHAGGRAIVVGLSLGGYTAMTLAARSPGRIRGLVVAGATLEPIGPAAIPFLALARLFETFDGDGLDALNRWFFRARFPPVIAEPLVAGGFWSAGGATAVRSLIGRRFAPLLAAYPGPVLFLDGEWDLLFRLGAPAFVRAARDVQRVRLRGATHLSNLDRPAAFSAAVRRFAHEVAAGP